VTRKLVEPTGRRGVFRLTKTGQKQVESHPTFKDAERAIASSS
jgi:hypothetical protein